MKIAIVWNYPSRLAHCSFRFRQYLNGFTALGHEPVVVCARDATEGFDGATWTVPSLDALRDPERWRTLGADVAVIVTWHRMSDVLSAIAAAGTRVVALADTDGRIGRKFYWRFNIERQIHYQRGWMVKTRFLADWCRQQLRQCLTRRFYEDEEAVSSTTHSHVVAFGHAAGRTNFTRFLESVGAADLASRLVVVPFTLGESYFTQAVPEHKQDRIIAVGRWDDPQKNTALLAATVERFLHRRPHTKVDVVGVGGESVFHPLTKRFDSFTYLGPRYMPQVAQRMANTRTILSASRWEGCPHAALEMLAMGGTLVGTPIPSLTSWVDSGTFGRVAERPSADLLSDALLREMANWDEGSRDPLEISRHWRARLHPVEVCGRLLE